MLTMLLRCCRPCLARECQPGPGYPVLSRRPRGRGRRRHRLLPAASSPGGRRSLSPAALSPGSYPRCALRRWCSVRRHVLSAVCLSFCPAGTRTRAGGFFEGPYVGENLSWSSTCSAQSLRPHTAGIATTRTGKPKKKKLETCQIANAPGLAAVKL